MKLRWVFFLLYFVCLFNAAHAASGIGERNENGEAHGMGIGGTIFNTWGFTYRHYLPSKIGIAINLGSWFTEYGGHIGTASGLSYTLAHHYFPSSWLPSSSLRIYGIGYAAGILRYHRREESVVDHKTVYKNEGFFDVGLGVGPGAEYFFTKNFAIHAELPWMTFIKIGKQTSFKSSYPHFGGGISYYF